MHILFLTDNFPPETNAPASRTYEHCRLWVGMGHRVTVVTGVPNFPQGIVFDGYRNRLFQRETLDGIEVVRVWTYIAKNEGFLKRTLDYMSFMAGATAASPAVRDADVLVATSPQFFTAIAGFLVSRMKRVPFVFELRDLSPESIVAVGAITNSRLISLLERVEYYLYRKANRVVALTHAFKETRIRGGVESDKIEVIPNGVNLEWFPFYALGVYRRSWRHSNSADIIGLGKALLAGSLLFALLAMVALPFSPPASVMVIDFLLFSLLAVAARTSFRLLEYVQVRG